MKENSIEEDIKDLKKYISFSKKHENFSHDADWKWHKEIGEKIERVLKENETYKKQYFCLINRIEHKIDKFDYEFEKEKRKNDNDRANYYWDLTRNFKKLLESEE